MQETIIGIFLGVGLAASAGFRVFLPLLALSLGAKFGIVPIGDEWSWVASNPAIITLAVATLVEILAYLIPFVDNLLDTAGVFLASAAGTMAVASTFTEMGPLVQWATAIIIGGGTAGMIKGGMSTVRAGSTVTTAGIANPVIGATETGVAAVGSVLSIFFPIIAIIVIIIMIYFTGKFVKKWNSLKT